MDDGKIVEEVVAFITDGRLRFLHPEQTARLIVTRLAERGRLVPEGWRRDIEYATYRGNARSANIGSPQYRREHAERERREDEHIVQRSILAGPWVAVEPEGTTDGR